MQGALKWNKHWLNYKVCFVAVLQWIKSHFKKGIYNIFVPFFLEDPELQTPLNTTFTLQQTKVSNVESASD